jgi:hypothetical protein
MLKSCSPPGIRPAGSVRDLELKCFHEGKHQLKLHPFWDDRINQLADHAEFYHLLSNSCTINIVRYANKAGRIGRLDLRHLLNGFIDSYIYSAGLVDDILPFDELRRRSRINEAALAAADAPDFSERIRASLPVPPH